MVKFRHFSRGMLSALCNNPANNKPIKGSRSATWQPKGDQRAQLYSHTSRTQRPFSAPRFPRISRVNGSHSKYEEEEGKRGREGWEREREKKKLANIHRSSSRKERQERERWEDRRQEAEGKKHSCALLPRGVSDTSRAPVVSYSRPGIEQVSRRRRKPRMAGRKSGGGKDVGGEK